MGFFNDYEQFEKPSKAKLKIEVCIVDMSIHELLVKTDEDAKPVVVPRKGVKLEITTLPYAILTLTENKAIAYNLI